MISVVRVRLEPPEGRSYACTISASGARLNEYHDRHASRAPAPGALGENITGPTP